LGWDGVEQPGLHEAGFTCWHKNGGTAFYGSDFFVLPIEKMAVMITGTSSGYGAGKLAERILLHALRDQRSISTVPSVLPSTPPPAVPASDAQLQALEGYYASSQGVTKVVRGDNGLLSLLAWGAGQWNVVASGLQLRDDGWFAADDAPRSYRASSIGSYHYLMARAPGGYGHYLSALPYAQRVQKASPLSPAWQSRLGQSWVLVNEHESSTALVLDSPLVTLEDIPELPGYVQIDGRQPLLPHDDMLTRPFLKIPVNFGRDLNELIVQPEPDGEWLLFGGYLYRPVSSVPSASVGLHVVRLDTQGNAQCLRLSAAASVQIAGSRAWRLYDAEWNSLAAGNGPGNAALSVGAAFFLMIFGEPNSQASVTLA